jgi:hypothetical protein
MFPLSWFNIRKQKNESKNAKGEKIPLKVLVTVLLYELSCMS